MSRTSTTPGDRSRDAVGGSSVLGRPPATIDPDWRERIEIAKRERDETRKARGDKPSTFDMRGPPIRIPPVTDRTALCEAVHVGRYERWWPI